MREKILFDGDWLFHKGDIESPPSQVKGHIYTSAKTERKKQGPACIYYNDATDDYRTDVEFNSDKWERVQLPHDYVISGEVYKDMNPSLGFFKYENGWYRKHFTIDESDKDKRVTLYFEGVATRCAVYLNGCELKHNLCGYTPFEVEIGDYLKYGEDNVLAVYTYFDSPEGWWYQGGGIYRHVWLCKTEPLAVDLYGVYVAPIYSNGRWTLELETTVLNDYFKDMTADIVTDVIDRGGNIIASATASVFVPSREKSAIKYSTEVENPTLWDVDNPYLYDIVTYIKSDGKMCDTYKTRTGFRYIKFSADDGFLLNGKRLIIKGVCGHGDFGLTGKAVPDNIFRYKTRLIKEMGANGYRCSHYPQAEAMMDAMDEQGLLVMCETRWFDSSELGKAELETLIKRDRNRPCVIMWSLGNEEPHHLTDTGRRIQRSLYALAKKLDKYRAVTAAVSHNPADSAVLDYTDAIGINYNHWSWDSVKQKYPNKPIYISECCATGTTRSWYFDDCAEKGYACAYDTDANMWWTSREKFQQFFDARPYLFGFFQWIAFEHRGEAVWPRLCSVAGAIDLFLQKKDAFYQNQSYFTDRPMIHLLPHWNFSGLEGEKIRVFAYTNCDELELTLNGKLIGRQSVARHTHGEWEVEYRPGKLECTAYRGGKRAAYDCVQTSGKAAALKLILDNAGDVSVGGDIAMVTCLCVDENGIEVPDAAPYVSFNANRLGRVAATGSDISDHTPVTESSRRMRAGRIGVAVKTGDEHGTLKIYAAAENLKSAVLNIKL